MVKSSRTRTASVIKNALCVNTRSQTLIKKAIQTSKECYRLALEADMKRKQSEKQTVSLQIQVSILTTEVKRLKELKPDDARVRVRLNRFLGDTDTKNNNTIKGALQRARRGECNPDKMHQKTKRLLKESKRWDDAVKLYRYSKSGSPMYKLINIS